MLRNILIGAGLLLAAILGAGWWLLFSDAKAPAKADGVMDLAAWRELVAADAGQGPGSIGWLEIGHDEFPSIAVQAGRFAAPVAMSFNAFQLVWPDRTVIIDTAVDAETMEEMSQTPAAAFDPAAYETLLDAMTRADRILLTHEHLDHVMGVARHPDPAAIAPQLALTETQRGALAPFTRGGMLPDAILAVPALDLSQPVRIAPGVVVAAMSGHTPGSEVIYVQRADGAEFLFIGDIAWTMRNIDDLTTRPLLLNLLFFDPPEVRANIRAQLRALHDLKQSDPALTVLPAHDRDYLLGLVAAGTLENGFVPAP
jgi:glyoxylase-like metal-dependent hydrolase (beta-lactamase superfamily II)